MTNVQQEVLLDDTGDTTGAWKAMQRGRRGTCRAKIDFDPEDVSPPHAVTIRIEGRMTNPDSPPTPDEKVVTLLSVTEAELGTGNAGGSYVEQILVMPFMRAVSENNDRAANVNRVWVDE